jgi:hypothetical protein
MKSTVKLNRRERMKKISVSLVLALILAAFISTQAFAMDVAGYKLIANATIKEALSGSVKNIDKLIADQKKLVEIGVAGCKEYAQKVPKDAKIMKLVISNANKMMAMTLEEIEPAWHEGGVLGENGIDFDAIDHFSPALSHMDTVVHPATTYIALKEYKKSKDGDLLEQVKDELSEVLEHLDHVE